MSNQPVRGQQYVFYITLVSRATGQFQVNPTIAAGDFQISKDGGAYNNLSTLPVVEPAGSESVKVTLSASETSAGNVNFRGKDVSGAEWDDVFVNIQPFSWMDANDIVKANVILWASGTVVTPNLTGIPKVDLVDIDGLATNGNNATLKLKSLDLQSSDTNALLVRSTASNKDAALFESNGAFCAGVYVLANGANANALYLDAAGSGGNALFGTAIDDDVIFLTTGAGKSINTPQDIAVSDGDLTLAAIASAVWAAVIETGYTAKQSMRLMLSALAGKLSGAATTNVQIRNVTDTKTRINATVDSDGNRTSVTHDTTD